MTLKWAERLTKVEVLAPCQRSMWNMLRRYILLKVFNFKELLIQVGMVGVAGIAQSLIVSEQWEGAGVFKEVEQS